MGRLTNLGRATRLAARFCLFLVGLVMVWRFTTTGKVSSSDLAGAAICLVALLIGTLISREGGGG